MSVIKNNLRIANRKNDFLYRKLKIDATHLNPFGPFFMPPGKFVEPGSILTLPITFAPKAEEDQVRFCRINKFLL